MKDIGIGLMWLGAVAAITGVLFAISNADVAGIVSIIIACAFLATTVILVVGK